MSKFVYIDGKTGTHIRFNSVIQRTMFYQIRKVDANTSFSYPLPLKPDGNAIDKATMKAFLYEVSNTIDELDHTDSGPFPFWWKFDNFDGQGDNQIKQLLIEQPRRFFFVFNSRDYFNRVKRLSIGTTTLIGFF